MLKNIELVNLGGQQSKRRRYMPFKDETEPSSKLNLPISLEIPKYVSEPESIKVVTFLLKYPVSSISSHLKEDLFRLMMKRLKLEVCIRDIRR